MEKSKMFSKANTQDILALTPMQEGMLFYYISNKDSEQYLEQLCLTLTGCISAEIIKKAWNSLAVDNELLRTVFRWEKLDKPLQIVLKQYDLPFIEHDISGRIELEKKKLLKEIKEKDYNEGIDISAEPLRIIIVKLEDNKFEVILTYHHILYDGWSNGIIIKEFIGACNALAEGIEPAKLEKNKFREYVKWLQTQNKEKQKQYWSKYFEAYNTQAVLNIGGIRESEQDSGKLTYVLPKQLSKDIYEFCKQEKTTIAALLYTSWGLMLQKYNNTRDAVFGATVSGRNAKIAGIEDMVGLFINTVPVRITSDNSESLLNILKRTDYDLKESEAYQSTSLADIKAYSGISSKEELFDTLVVIENYPLDKLINNESRVKIEEFSMDEKTNYKLTLAIVDYDGLKLEFAYDQIMFDAESIQRMTGHFLNIIKQMLENPSTTASQIDILTHKEKQQLILEFNKTYAEYPKTKTLHEVFEEQVKETPDNIALIFEDKQLTYRELNNRANQLARTLKDKGAKSDSLIGIMAERSIDMIVGIMAILKSGAGYLPIDVSYPGERIQYMLEDSGADILVTQSWLADKLKHNGQAVMLDDEASYNKDCTDLEYVSSSNDLAYVIYTSGSTGKPKGIMIEHYSVLNLVYSQRKEFGIDQAERILQFSTVCFDASVEQIFTCLLSGAALVLVSKERLLDIPSFEEYIADKAVTHMHAVPAFLAGLKWRDNYKLRRVISGGDVCPQSLIEEWYKHCDFYNEYGPTETTVTSIELLIDEKANKHSIGKAVANTRLYVVDENNKLLPVGVAGELCIAGDGLARGYLNREELTRERFVNNPFENNAKMYRTGDLARWLTDGSIEFLGRIDNQVKIRGFRIELGEIESKLISHEAVKEAIVVVKEDKSGNKYLCAYTEAAKELSTKELREYLAKELPEYMIPAYFIQLDSMPLTPSGKIDRKALSSRASDIEGALKLGSEYEAPRNETEQKLAEIWKQVLQLDKVGINDDFFELGGHSLKAANLAAKIHKQLEVEIPIKEIFRTSTIKGLSEYINSLEETAYYQIQPIEQQEGYSDNCFEMSSAQKRIYMLQQFDTDSTGYNMPGVLEIQGQLDIDRLEKAFKILINRHEALRTSFEQSKEGLLQRIHNYAEFKLQNLDIEVQENETLSAIIKQTSDEFIKPFDLSKAPLLRAALITLPKQHCFEELENHMILPKQQHYFEEMENQKILPKQQHMLLLDIHHIISDGISMEILTREFAAAYEDRPLPELRIQYKDYAAWQNQLFASDKIKKQEAYWLEVFKGDLPVLNMPTDYQRPAVQSFEGNSKSFSLDKALTDKLKQMAKETGSTLYMVLLTAFNILLSKYTSQEDIVIGSPIAGRPHADLENVIGMFVNTLAMRNYPKEQKTVKEFLEEVKQNALKAYDNQDYQFEELIDKLNITRDLSRNPLFDLMFVMQNMDTEELKLKDLTIKSKAAQNNISKFDITFTAAEVLNEIEINIQYCTKLFESGTIDRMFKHLENILVQMTVNTETQLKALELITEAEKQQIMVDFNDTEADYPKDKVIHQLFEEQVRRTPNNIAVVHKGQKLTYMQLNHKANQLARTLRDNGVGANSIVAIIVNRSLEMIVGIIGILKAGGAYLPIDPEYPKDRIQYMLEDSGTEIILSQEAVIKNMEVSKQVIFLDREEAYAHSSRNLHNINKPNDMAYVIYTSGTTGKPKGAIIENMNVVRLMFNSRMQFDFDSKDVWTMFHSFCFDFSVWEMYGALLYGGKLIVVPKEVAQHHTEFLKLLKRERVTILNQTPTAFFNLLNEEVKSNNKRLWIRYIIFGGEALKPIMLRSWKERYPHTKLINMYGITETTVHVTYKEITDYEIDNNISNIGIPIPTLTTYVMDKNMKLLPVGVPGELCVGGDGVCRGYLNKPELTAQKFTENPHKPGERIYRSGDLVKLLENGEMEYLGRIDHQVKIRGHRIELGEIENKLLSHDTIKEAVVIVREDKNGQYLCAYLVADKELTVTELRGHLSKDLPEYMIPSYFITLDKMPLTSNGKVDRKALPEPDGTVVTGAEYEAPRDDREQKLVEIWQAILGVDKIGINDNFFELGGHSLKATNMVARIHKELDIEIPLKEVFGNSTIKGLSEYVKNIKNSKYSEIKPVEQKEYYQMSSAQNRMFTLTQFDTESTGYNMPVILELEGKLDAERLERAFNILADRHESLRTSFEITEEGSMQRVHSKVCLKIEQLGAVLSTDKSSIENIINSFIRPFDLSEAPLVRVGLIKLINASEEMENHMILPKQQHCSKDMQNESVLPKQYCFEELENHMILPKQQHMLLLDIHHIISDGVSMGILVREFAAAYEGRELKELKIQYKDYAAWQRQRLEAHELKRQEGYWHSVFADDVPVLDLPADYPRPSIQSFEGDSITFNIDNKLKEKLSQIAKTTGTTMYMVLLSTINVLLSKYSGQEDIVIGSPIAGRPHADLDNIIGMFVNTLAMRNRPAGLKTFRGFLEEVKQHALRAYDNQDYQFEELVDKLRVARDMSRNPIFDVMFIMQNMEIGKLELEGISIKPYAWDVKISKLDMTFTAREAENGMSMEIQYCTKLFKRETIEKMYKHYHNIITAVTENPDIQLNNIDMLTEEEKNKILIDFNDTRTEYPKNKMLYELFEEQVSKNPDKTALIFRDSRLTYKELNDKADKLAGILRAKGVVPDSIVGIMTARSLEMIIGIMGILKAGGAYLPIDPEYPIDRIEYMLEDSNAGLLVTQAGISEGLSFANERILLDHEALLTGDTNNVLNANNSNYLAYVIYTSGSTGKPKGVMLEHKSVVNFITGMTQKIDFSESKTILALTTICFDIFGLETLLPLTQGMKIVIADEETQIDPIKLIKLIKDEKIDILQATPSRMEMLLTQAEENDFDGLKEIIIGGEALSQHLFEKLKAKAKGKIYNVYGPTETTIWSTLKELNTRKEASISIGEPITIGAPIANTDIYILDKNLNVQPVGVTGELYIGGDGLARGYLNREELTASKFINNPFKPSGKMYKTGDLAKWLPNGEIEFVGRVDHQVKIRGYRIELEEIEKKLLEHESVKETIVVAKDDKNGNKYLCAYLVGEQEIAAAEVREYLTRLLPEYMIPSYFVQLKKIPLTPNGKINRKELPEPDMSTMANAKYEAPRNDVEYHLVDIWKEILSVDKLGINDNFFEIGGHSLKATIMIAKVHKTLNVEIPLRILFNTPTIKGLYEYIRTTDKNIYSTIKPIPKKEVPFYAASSAQKRMYTLQQLEPESTAYNMPLSMELEGELNIQRVEEAFRAVIQRHEALRTSFELMEDEIVQTIHHEAEFKIEHISITDQGELPNVIKQFVKPFSLNKAPLLRVGLIKLTADSEEQHYCFQDMENRKLLPKEQHCSEQMENRKLLPKEQHCFEEMENRKILPKQQHCFEEMENRKILPKQHCFEGMKNRTILPKQQHMLLLDMHHIISDGTSMGILTRDFMSAYSGKELPDLEIQYKDFAAWQNNMHSSENIGGVNIYHKSMLASQEEYWLEQFRGAIPVLNMPADYPRPAVQSIEGDNISFKLDKELTGRLKEAAKQTNGTLYMVMLGAFNILLSKYSGQEDIVVGSPIAGRPHADLQNIIGMFVNTLAMRNYPEGQKTIREFLEEVRENSLKAYENQDYQFEELVDKLNITRDMSRNPLFDVMFIMQNMQSEKIEAEGITIKPYNEISSISKFDMTLTSYEAEEQINLNLEYCIKLFKKDTAERFLKHYTVLLENLTNNLDIPISQLDILSTEEKKQILIDFNDIESDYPRSKTIHQLFEEQVNRTPESIALTYQDDYISNKALTYKELNERANQLARAIINKKADKTAENHQQAGKVVGIMVERSLEMIVAILGVLKAGMAFVPIDPEYPQDRITYMIENSGINILITQQNLMNKIENSIETININNQDIYELDKTNLNTNSSPEDLFYIIYTSGSTGKPKGVMLTHRNINNLINFEYSKTEIDFKCNVLQFTTMSFDVCYQEICSTLLAGGKLHITSKDNIKDVSKLLDFIKSNEIKVMFMATAYFKYIINEPSYLERLSSSLEHIIVAGEQLQLTNNLIKYLKDNNVYLHNHYGPSEAHVVTTYTLKPEEYMPILPPIGKPISNTSIYILDKYNKVCPIGVTGELYISGDCVGKGYVNRSELTMERFISDPFMEGRIMYRTGDLARWLPDGNIEYQGRIDHQVKIRGFRIELGEIESKLLGHRAIKEAVVMAQEDNNKNKFICAYIVIDKQQLRDKELTISELREYLSKDLPDYMIPSYYVQLEQLPFTPNGKIDKKSLADKLHIDKVASADTTYEAPMNYIEEKLSQIWKAVLNVEKISINDNFFDIGGHSLKATSVAAKIAKELKADIPLKQIFKTPTIKGLAHYIKGLEENIYASIEAIPERDYYEISSAQNRIYIMQQHASDSTSYNIPGALEIEGGLDTNKLESAFKVLIQRHDAFRTSFKQLEGKIVQKILSNAEFELEHYKLQAQKEMTVENINSIIKDFIRPFDLSKAPLLRVGIISAAEQNTDSKRNILIYDLHHIISDGVSLQVLIEELLLLYRGSELPELRIQYKDYTAWHNKMKSSEKMQRQEQFWLKEFEKEVPELTLPIDYERPSIQGYQGDAVYFELDQQMTEGLKNLCKATGTTMYMMLMANYYVLLSKCSMQEDIVIGSPIAGRPHADLESIIGIFVNTLAIRCYPQGQKTFMEFLNEVKHKCMEVYDNQDYQFEELIDKLNIKASASQNPLFNVMLVLQNTQRSQALEQYAPEGTRIMPYNVESKTAKFDLTLGAVEADNKLSLSLEYSTALFKEATIKMLVDLFIDIIKSIIENPNQQLSALNLQSGSIAATVQEEEDVDFDF